MRPVRASQIGAVHRLGQPDLSNANGNHALLVGVTSAMLCLGKVTHLTTALFLHLQDALNNISYMASSDLPVPAMDLRRAALDLAVRSKQLACAQLLRPGVPDLSRSFLVAAAESGCSEMLRWALQTWCSQFNCIHGFGPCCVDDLHAALRYEEASQLAILQPSLGVSPAPWIHTALGGCSID